MTHNPLEHEISQRQAKEAVKRQLLRQYDALNEALLLGKEDKYTGFYNKTIAPHQKTLLGDIVENSGITTKALDDALEQIDVYANHIDDTKIDSSRKRLKDACKFVLTLENGRHLEGFNIWRNNRTLDELIKTGTETECYNQLIKLVQPNGEHVEQLLEYAIPNPPLKKMQKACAYVCGLSEDHKNKFLKWLEKNSTYTPNQNNNVNRAIREIAYKNGYDKCYDELRNIVKSEYANKIKEAPLNWKEKKEKLLKEKKKNNYDEYFSDDTKKEFTAWVNSHLVKTKIRSDIHSEIDKVNSEIDKLHLSIWKKYFLKKEFYDRVNRVFASDFDQSNIDEFDLTQYSPEVQSLFTNALNSVVKMYRQEPAIVDDFDSAWRKTGTILTDVIYDKLDELTEKNYQGNFNRAAAVARNSAKTELDDWVRNQQESRGRFERSLENKSANELLVILAETTKITTQANESLEKLNNASYENAENIVTSAKTTLDSSISTASGSTPTEEQHNTISGPVDITQYEIDETRKLLNNTQTQFEKNPEIYTEQDRQDLARWAYYQNHIKQGYLNDFNIDIRKKLSLGITDDDKLIVPDYRLRSRIEKIIEHGSYNQITDAELNQVNPAIKDWLIQKRDAFNSLAIPSLTDDIKKLTDAYCADDYWWNRYQKRKLINVQLKALLDKKEEAIHNSLLGKVRLEKAKALYRDFWTRTGIIHAFGFSIAAALTMGGSLILILIAMIFFSTPPGMALMLFSTAIILGGVYLGNWFITKHDVADLFLTIFPDPNKSWIRQFAEEAIKNPLAFTVSNFAAFLSALFTAVAAYTVAATIIALFAPISLPIIAVLLLTVAAPSFYYTYPTYFAISHIFSRMMTRNTYASHLKEIEEIALINDQTSIRKWYPFLLGLAMLAILGVMLAAAPALFVGFAFVGVPVILAQVLGYAMVVLSMGGIGSFYFYRSKGAAVRLIKDNGGRDPFKNLQENTLRKMNGKPNPYKLTILSNILEQLQKFNLTLKPTEEQAKQKLIQAVLNEILFNKKSEANFSPDEEKFLKTDQGTLGKLYRIYLVREDAQEALTLWGKSFEGIRILNAIGNMLPSVFGFMAGLPAGTPLAVIWGLGILAGVGGTGASWAANSNGIEEDYTVEPEIYAAQRNLNDLVTITWFTNLNAFNRALNHYKNNHKDKSFPDYVICLKLIKLAKDIKDNGFTKEVISEGEKEIIKNSHLHKIYEEMGEHLVRAVEVQQGKRTLFTQNIDQQLKDYELGLDKENRWYEYSIFGYTRNEKKQVLIKLEILRTDIQNGNYNTTTFLTPREIKILKNGRLGNIYNQMDKYTIGLIELNGYMQELKADLFFIFFQKTFLNRIEVCSKLLKIIKDIKEHGFTNEFLTPDELKIAKSGTLGKIFSNMDKNVTGPIELAAYKQQLKVEVGEEDTENNKRSDSNFSVLGFKFGFAKIEARTFQITIFSFSFSFTIPRFKGYSKAEKWQALEALTTPILDEVASTPPSPNTSASAKPVVRSAHLKTFYGNGRLGQIFANLDSPAKEKLINQDSASGELAALIQELKDYSADRKNGDIYSTGDTNLGAASRAEKIAVADKLQYALEKILSENYTTCEFTDREREILTDGKLKDIYVKAQKYIDVLYVSAPAVRFA